MASYLGKVKRLERIRSIVSDFIFESALEVFDNIKNNQTLNSEKHLNDFQTAFRNVW